MRSNGRLGNFTGLHNFLIDAKFWLEFAAKATTVLLTVILAAGLKLGANERGVEGRDLTVMICCQTTIVFIIDANVFLLDIVYDGTPFLNACKSRLEQMADFRLHWSGYYAEVAKNGLVTAKIGYYTSSPRCCSTARSGDRSTR